MQECREKTRTVGVEATAECVVFYDGGYTASLLQEDMTGSRSRFADAFARRSRSSPCARPTQPSPKRASYGISRGSHEDVQREQRAHQQIGHVYRLADA